MGKYTYSSLGDRLKNEYKIFIAAFIFIVIADSIGEIKIPIGKGLLILFPIFYSLILGIVSGPQVFKIFKEKEVKAASKLVMVAICPFIAKLGISAGANLDAVISAGPALVLQELGHLGTIFVALPIALLLGLKREAVGATHSLNREANLALMNDMYGSDSDETRGSLSIYIIGGMIGTIYFGFVATMVASTGIFHPYAVGMAAGAGSGVMMASAVASLVTVYPDMANEISALASASETLSAVTGLYMSIFISIPLCNKLYNVLEPRISRWKNRKSEGVKGEIENEI